MVGPPVKGTCTRRKTGSLASTFGGGWGGLAPAAAFESPPRAAPSTGAARSGFATEKDVPLLPPPPPLAAAAAVAAAAAAAAAFPRSLAASARERSHTAATTAKPAASGMAVYA
jgi:hypothetical protein